MANYEKAGVKLTNAQLNKLKFVEKVRLKQYWELHRKTIKTKNGLMNYFQ